jgi:hypothetical protein
MLVALVAGCGSENFELELKLAEHLQRLGNLRSTAPGPDRDEAFARLAEDVCSDGFPELSHVALDHIASEHLRETIAVECALVLEKGKAPCEAARIARRIRSHEELRTVMQALSDQRRN